MWEEKITARWNDTRGNPSSTRRDGENMRSWLQDGFRTEAVPAWSQSDQQKGPWFNPLLCSAPLTLWLKRKEGTHTHTHILLSCASPGDLSIRVILITVVVVFQRKQSYGLFLRITLESSHIIRLPGLHALTPFYSPDIMKYRRELKNGKANFFFFFCRFPSLCLSLPPRGFAKCTRRRKRREEEEKKRGRGGESLRRRQRDKTAKWTHAALTAEALQEAVTPATGATWLSCADLTSPAII